MNREKEFNITKTTTNHSPNTSRAWIPSGRTINVNFSELHREEESNAHPDLPDLSSNVEAAWTQKETFEL